MSISGKVRENVESSKKVGLFLGKVICINPSVEEYKEILGIELKEDSKATEYLGESKEGNTTLRVNFWVETVKKDFKSSITFFLENKQKENKTQEGDGKVKKYQYINDIGSCSWAESREKLPDWFKKREHRIAFAGEEELYNFVRIWLGKLSYSDPDTTLQVDWKQLMKGNVKSFKEQIEGEFTTNVGSMAIIKTVEKDGELKEYQGIWNKAFLPEYAMKYFRVSNYNDDIIVSKLKDKEIKSKVDKNIKLAAHERFVLTAIGEYGIKDFYSFVDLKEYDSSENAASNPSPGTDENGGDLPF